MQSVPVINIIFVVEIPIWRKRIFYLQLHSFLFSIALITLFVVFEHLFARMIDTIHYH